MAILRKQKTGNFTTVNNYFINDPNLKPDGKGFLLFMLSKPDDWKFNFINFQKSLGIGQKAVRSLVNKLEQLKYLKRERIRDEFGHYEWNYFVYEEPYDLVLKRENTPYSPSGYLEQGYAVEGNVYQNTNITNTESNKDKLEPNTHKIIKMILTPKGYISNYDGEIEVKINWIKNENIVEQKLTKEILKNRKKEPLKVDAMN